MSTSHHFQPSQIVSPHFSPLIYDNPVSSTNLINNVTNCPVKTSNSRYSFQYNDQNFPSEAYINLKNFSYNTADTGATGLLVNYENQSSTSSTLPLTYGNLDFNSNKVKLNSVAECSSINNLNEEHKTLIDPSTKEDLFDLKAKIKNDIFLNDENQQNIEEQYFKENSIININKLNNIESSNINQKNKTILLNSNISYNYNDSTENKNFKNLSKNKQIKNKVTSLNNKLITSETTTKTSMLECSSSNTAATYVNAITNTNHLNVTNSAVNQNLLPSTDLPNQHSINEFYVPSNTYMPSSFIPDPLLENNNSGIVPGSVNLIPPYCWPTPISQASHSHLQMSGMEGYGGLNEAYGSTNAMQTQLPFGGDSNLTNNSNVTVTGTEISANYNSSLWCSNYYLPLEEKLTTLENCVPTNHLNPYMNVHDRHFYASSCHLLPGVPPSIENFNQTSSTVSNVSTEVINTLPLLNNNPTISNSNSVLTHLDAPTSDLYGHSQESLYSQLQNTTSNSLFIDLLPNQQTSQQSNHPELVDIYQQNQVYMNISNNTTNSHSFNVPSINVESSNIEILPTTSKLPKTVRRGRSAKAKTTVSSTSLNNNLLAIPHTSSQQPLNQQSTTSNFNYEINNDTRSSSISNYSRSLSPINSGLVPKMPRKNRSRAKDSEDDDTKSIEDKEAERRTANNTRERIRVRDINCAFKELAKLCCQHLPNTEEKSLTKLNTLLKAVDLIPMLEEKVRQRNLDPRMACIKRNDNSDIISSLS